MVVDTGNHARFLFVNTIFVTYHPHEDTRILEGDRVALFGQSFSLITYESDSGSGTVPRIYAYQIVIVPRGDPMPLGRPRTAPSLQPVPPGEIQTPYDELNRGNTIERK
jgi:hypothetical protein